MTSDESLQNMSQELRRGVIMLAVLSQLSKRQYGYALLRLLSDEGLQIDQGTLYPLLRRLESQGLLQSSWSVDEARPRRYYMISNDGRRLLPKLKREWEAMVAAMARLLKP